MNWLALILVFAIGSAQAQYTFPFPLPKPSEPAKYDAPTLYGDVDEHSAAVAIQAIHAENRKATSDPIKLYLQSPGGSVMAGGAVISAMAASRRPVETVIVGGCASMCAVIAEYGTTRTIAGHGYIMFHNASVGMSGELTHIASHLGMITRAWARYEEYIAKRIGITTAEFRAHEAEEWWLTADEAKQARLADVVANPADYPVPKD